MSSDSKILTSHKPLCEIAKGIPLGVMLGTAEKWMPKGLPCWILLAFRILEKFGEEFAYKEENSHNMKERHTKKDEKDEGLFYCVGGILGFAITLAIDIAIERGKKT